MRSRKGYPFTEKSNPCSHGRARNSAIWGPAPVTHRCRGKGTLISLNYHAVGETSGVCKTTPNSRAPAQRTLQILTEAHVYCHYQQGG